MMAFVSGGLHFLRLTAPVGRHIIRCPGTRPCVTLSEDESMKELLLMIVSPLLAIFGFGYDKKEEPDREDDQFEHLWRDTGGEG